MMTESLVTAEEKLLMRLCVRAPIMDDEFDWDNINVQEFIKMSYGHGMFGWVRYHAKTNHLAIHSKEFLTKVYMVSRLLEKTNHDEAARQDAFIARILDIMQKGGYRGIVMKGPVLQAAIYTDKPYVRPFGDLDVLLPEKQALDLYSHLLQYEGFQYVRRYNKNYESWNKAVTEMAQHLIPLYDENGTVEIHHRLSSFFMTVKPDLRIIFKNAISMSTRWGEMLIPDKYDMFVMLCYHMYYHNCYENEVRLLLHIDIIDWLCYMQETEPIDWLNKLQARVQEHNLFDVVSYCIVQTQEVLECIGFSNYLCKDILDIFATEESRNKAEEIHSRFMLCETAFGHWNIPYVKRIFMDKQMLEKEVAYAIYRNLIVEKWEPKLHSIGVYDIYPQADGHYW